MSTIETWTNHIGTFAAHPITGAHLGPFKDAQEARAAVAEIGDSAKPAAISCKEPAEAAEPKPAAISC